MDTALAHDDAILQARQVLCEKYVVVDTETTGLQDPEVCQLAYVYSEQADGFSTLVQPVSPISAGATQIHHITNEMVATVPSIDSYWPMIGIHWANRTVIGYNVQYDLKTLATSFGRRGIEFKWHDRKLFDVMYAYAAYVGEINPKYGTFKWHKLEEALKRMSIDFGDMHDALTDARATLALLGALANQKTYWELALDLADVLLDSNVDTTSIDEGAFQSARDKVTYRLK